MIKYKERKQQTIIPVSFRKEDEDLLNEFEKLQWKEQINFSKLMRNAMSEYVRNHKAGNPAFTLDQFKDPEFKVCPSFFENRNKWAKYIKNCNDKELDGIETKSDLVKSMINTERHGRRIGSNLVL